ncbi:hypothetical protein P376_3188 [Streptomyces sp. HCCB10043]|nr:hypothetical protein P376_3188 [Streptomyces sp. HCCB10043]
MAPRAGAAGCFPDGIPVARTVRRPPPWPPGAHRSAPSGTVSAGGPRPGGGPGRADRTAHRPALERRGSARGPVRRAHLHRPAAGRPRARRRTRGDAERRLPPPPRRARDRHPGLRGRRTGGRGGRGRRGAGAPLRPGAGAVAGRTAGGRRGPGPARPDRPTARRVAAVGGGGTRAAPAHAGAARAGRRRASRARRGAPRTRTPRRRQHARPAPQRAVRRRAAPLPVRVRHPAVRLRRRAGAGPAHPVRPGAPGRPGPAAARGAHVRRAGAGGVAAVEHRRGPRPGVLQHLRRVGRRAAARLGVAARLPHARGLGRAPGPPRRPHGHPAAAEGAGASGGGERGAGGGAGVPGGAVRVPRGRSGSG